MWLNSAHQLRPVGDFQSPYLWICAAENERAKHRLRFDGGMFGDGGREEAAGPGAENWKRELFNNGWALGEGVSDCGASKLDHLQPVKQILFQKFPPFYPASPIINNSFIMGKEEGRKQQGLKIGRGNSSTVDETKGVLTLVNSNWTICSLLNWFLHNVSTFLPSLPQ